MEVKKTQISGSCQRENVSSKFPKTYIYAVIGLILLGLFPLTLLEAQKDSILTVTCQWSVTLPWSGKRFQNILWRCHCQPRERRVLGIPWVWPLTRFLATASPWLETQNNRAGRGLPWVPRAAGCSSCLWKDIACGILFPLNASTVLWC